MKTFVKKNNWIERTPLNDFGWGNGYIVIPKGHPLHGKDHVEILDLIPSLTVNGGLTFSKSRDRLKWKEIPEGNEGAWIIGFDTIHLNDTLEIWSKEAVIEETENLKKQLQDYTIHLERKDESD